MNINTLQIKEEQKEKHKQLFMNHFIRFMDIRLSNMRYKGNLDENEITEYLLRDRNEDMWNEDEWMYERWDRNEDIYLKGYRDDYGVWYLLDYYLFDYSK